MPRRRSGPRRGAGARGGNTVGWLPNGANAGGMQTPTCSDMSNSGDTLFKMKKVNKVKKVKKVKKVFRSGRPVEEKSAVSGKLFEGNERYRRCEHFFQKCE